MTKSLPTRPKLDKATNRAFVYWKGAKTYFGKWGSADATAGFSKWYLEHRQDEPPAPIPPAVMVADCVKAFIDHARIYYSSEGKKTQEFRNLEASIDVLLRHEIVLLPVADFGPKKLIELQATLVAETIGEPPEIRYSRSTINAIVHRIRRIFRWCASQEMVPAELVTSLEMVDGLRKGRTVAREADPVVPVPIDHVLETIRHTSPTVSAMIRVQTLAGMRPSEVCRMTMDAIDLTGGIWLYRLESHKTSHRGKSLVKAIPLLAQEILRPFLDRQPGEPIFSPSDSLEYWHSQTRIKPSKRKRKPVRRPYTTGSYGKAIFYAIERAKNHSRITIPHWSPNQLRHLIGTQVRRQSGIEAAQIFLGHSKPDVTLLYAERSEERLIEIARGIVSPLDSPKDQ